MKVLKQDEMKEEYSLCVRNVYDALKAETEESIIIDRQFVNLREAIE